jgi:hypothetical protein
MVECAAREHRCGREREAEEVVAVGAAGSHAAALTAQAMLGWRGAHHGAGAAAPRHVSASRRAALPVRPPEPLR